MLLSKDKKAMRNSRMKDPNMLWKRGRMFLLIQAFFDLAKKFNDTQVKHSKLKHKTQGFSKNLVKIIAERKGTKSENEG